MNVILKMSSFIFPLITFSYVPRVLNSLRVVNSKCTNEKNAHYENPFCTGRVFFRAGCHDYESASVSFHGPCVVDSEELIHCRNDSLLVFLAF